MSAKKLSPAQREWCKHYERETTFEPLMCDFKAGNESFEEAARKSLAWFESWASDAYLRASDRPIPLVICKPKASPHPAFCYGGTDGSAY